MAKAKRTEITQEVVMAVCESVAEGQTLTAAAKAQNTSPSAIRYKIMNDAALFSLSARARESGCDALADQCIEIADDPTIDPADKRIRIDTRIRLIGKWSKRYSDKLTVESNSTVTHKYDLDNLPDAELDQLERILAHARASASGEGAAVPAIVH